MSGRFAARFAPECARLAVALRTRDGIQACEREGAVWLRTAPEAISQEQWTRHAAGGELYRLQEDGQLIPIAGRVPCGRLPDGPWQPIAKWARLTVPQASFPAARPAPATLRLVPGGEFSEPDVLILPLDSWRRYVERAPRFRFRSLKFAVSSDRRALVTGRPLPPLAGDRYVRRDRIVVPAGWTWTPAVDAASLAAAMGLAGDDLLLWHADGSCDHVAASRLSIVTRSAVRSVDEGAP